MKKQEKPLEIGVCVKIPDGRIGRIREKVGQNYKVRVRRKTSQTHQFLELLPEQLQIVPCPKGWMSVEGYRRYLEKTLAKMKARKGKVNLIK